MINHHLGRFNVHRVLLEPLVQVPIGLAADIEEQVLDVVQFVLVARLVVYVVAQILQIFHSRATSLWRRYKSISYWQSYCERIVVITS